MNQIRSFGIFSKETNYAIKRYNYVMIEDDIIVILASPASHVSMQTTEGRFKVS